MREGVCVLTPVKQTKTGVDRETERERFRTLVFSCLPHFFFLVYGVQEASTMSEKSKIENNFIVKPRLGKPPLVSPDKIKAYILNQDSKSICTTIVQHLQHTYSKSVQSSQRSAD